MGEILILINKYSEDEMKPGELSLAKKLASLGCVLNIGLFQESWETDEANLIPHGQKPEPKIVEYLVSGSKVRVVAASCKVNNDLEAGSHERGVN